jgi:hypothetical protein
VVGKAEHHILLFGIPQNKAQIYGTGCEKYEADRYKYRRLRASLIIRVARRNT